MELEIRPTADDDGRMAIAFAVEQARVQSEAAWLRAGRAEATGVEGEDDVWPPLYALSPRMTRGATRA